MAGEYIIAIIVNFHSQALVCSCIDSLKEKVLRPLGLVVVDNSTLPDTICIESRFPDVVILRPGSNLGFAGGCNVGIRYALGQGADYILLLNPDTRTEHDFVEPLISALRKNDTLGMIGPRIIEDSGEGKTWFGGGGMNWWLGGPRHRVSDTGGKRGAVETVSFLSGCAMLIRDRAVKEVGPMDERYFLYFEDGDYVQRFLKSGWQVGYVADSHLRHLPSSTTGFGSKTYVYYFSRNRIWFMKQWAKPYHFLVFMAYNTLIKLPGAVLVFGVWQKRMDLVRAFFYGFLDGLKTMPARQNRRWHV